MPKSTIEVALLSKIIPSFYNITYIILKHYFLLLESLTPCLPTLVLYLSR